MDWARHEASQPISVLQASALSVYFRERLDDSPAEDESRDVVGEDPAGFVSHLYARLTLTNVLYFGGAMLVISALTLFMTLGFQKFGGQGIFLIASTYALVFEIIGLRAWRAGTSNEMLGGVLCTVSVCMVPLAVYGFEKSSLYFAVFRSSNHPNANFRDFNSLVRGEWVVMEISTVLAGLSNFVVMGVRFPFMLMPISFALFYLSMDIIMRLPQRFKLWFSDFADLRKQMGLWFGLVMLFAAFWLQCAFGNDPDFGFWLFVFGGLMFRISTMFASKHRRMTYWLANVALLVSGRVLDRTMLSTLGFIGVLELFPFFAISNMLRLRRSALMGALRCNKDDSFHAVLLFMATTTLFLSAMSPTAVASDIAPPLSWDFPAAILAWLGLCVAVSPRREWHFLVLLSHSLGIMAFCAQFNDRALSLILFNLPVWFTCFVTSSASGAGILYFHAGLITQEVTLTSTWAKELFSLYRMAVSIGIAVAIVILGLPQLAWLGALGLVITPLLKLAKRASSRLELLAHFAWGVGPVAISGVWFESSVMSLLATGTCLAVIMKIVSQGERGEGLSRDAYLFLCAVMGTVMVFASILYESTLMISAGGVVVAIYLTYLSNRMFKNSMMFPLVMTLAGICLIYAGLQYQEHAGALHATMIRVLPMGSLLQFRFRDQVFVQIARKQVEDSLRAPHAALTPLDWFGQGPYMWIWAWYAPMMRMCLEFVTPMLLMWATVALAFVSTLISYARLRLAKLASSFPRGGITSLSLALAEGTQGHGVVLEVFGDKPRDLCASQIRLNVYGKTFWKRVIRGGSVPGAAVSLVRRALLPLPLIPKRLHAEHGLIAGDGRIALKMHIGTGENGSYRVSRDTILRLARSLRKMNTDVMLSFDYLPSSQATMWSRLFSPFVPLASASVTTLQISNMLNAPRGKAIVVGDNAGDEGNEGGDENGGHESDSVGEHEGE